MLNLRRANGDWVIITHAGSGDVIRVRVRNPEPGRVDMNLDDPLRKFEVSRPEARLREYLKARTDRAENLSAVPDRDRDDRRGA